MFQIPPDQVSAVMLGIMQDGGLPHIGCRCPRCVASFSSSRPPELVTCLGIVDTRTSPAGVWLIDATPDVKYQIELLAGVLGQRENRPDRVRPPDAIFLTHAHMGHIGGLPQFGPEAMDVHQLPVYAAAGLVQLLDENALWQPVAKRLALNSLDEEISIQLRPDLQLTPIPVPHRDEWGIGTYAFRLRGPQRDLLYLPDIDTWEAWPGAQAELSVVDWAIVDACFYSPLEIAGRTPVAHPFIPHTLDLFGDLPTKFVLTHFNHTNPVLDMGSKERLGVVEAGAVVAFTGQIFAL